MRRALIVSMLILLSLAGRAEAQPVLSLSEDQEMWLRLWDGSNAELKNLVAGWTMGVNETSQLVALARGCKSDPVSGGALVSATADLLRQNKMKPLVAAVIAYRKLSGCHDAIDRFMQAK